MARSPGSSIGLLSLMELLLIKVWWVAVSLSNYPTNFYGGTPILAVVIKVPYSYDGHSQEALNAWEHSSLLDLPNASTSWCWCWGLHDQMGYKIANYNIESLPLGGGIETTVAQQVNAYQMLFQMVASIWRAMIDSIADPDWRSCLSAP